MQHPALDALVAEVRRRVAAHRVKYLVKVTPHHPFRPIWRRQGQHGGVMPSVGTAVKHVVVCARFAQLVQQAVHQGGMAELVLAGGPPRAQLPRARGYQEVSALARRLRLDDRLCLTGHLSPDLTPALIRSADVVLALAPAQPFAMVALDHPGAEALRVGAPAVVSA